MVRLLVAFELLLRLGSCDNYSASNSPFFSSFLSRGLVTPASDCRGVICFEMFGVSALFSFGRALVSAIIINPSS
jgi:hypothetical protein